MALAASGAISSTAKYAWGNDTGWVNFAPSNSTVTVTDAGLTGYAWSQNDGWLNLAPAHSGVTNNGQGTLGGFAWDESRGWVSFSGVTINSSGVFQGEATGANGYAINFSCSNCDVVTAWRPASTNTSASPGAISPVYAAPQPSGPPPFSVASPPITVSNAVGSPVAGTAPLSRTGPSQNYSPPAVSRTSTTSSILRAAVIPVGVGVLIIVLLFGVWFFILCEPPLDRIHGVPNTNGLYSTVSLTPARKRSRKGHFPCDNLGAAPLTTSAYTIARSRPPR